MENETKKDSVDTLVVSELVIMEKIIDLLSDRDQSSRSRILRWAIDVFREKHYDE